MKKVTTQRLVRFNAIMSLLHAVQAGLILVLSKSFSLPISGSFLKFNESTQNLDPASKVLFNLSLPALIFSFFVLSSLAHLFIATVYKDKYQHDLNKGINKVRWIEYSFSASIMIVAISLLVGIYDLGSLIMLFGLTAVMNLCGLVMEVHNQTTQKTNWLSYYVGCIAGAIPWVVIALYLALGASDGSKAPAFVYWIFVSIFLFFNCFAVNMVLQYKKIGPWKNYLYGERAYIILSLVAKSLLAWQVFAGTLRP
ncbi:MAG: heliorhodopsin HeR [Candidatus Nomurabacteria bacterium]|nr:MAG: heliorhodopsin HeR [Candidatus Nomurabacteria bacterium]HRV75809.1 heliorhodopsin HeR [Candidatus Saccharimonadales bacterium]